MSLKDIVSYVDLVANGIDNLLQSIKAGDSSVNLSSGVVRNNNTVHTSGRDLKSACPLQHSNMLESDATHSSTAFFASSTF